MFDGNKNSIKTNISLQLSDLIVLQKVTFNTIFHIEMRLVNEIKV